MTHDEFLEQQPKPTRDEIRSLNAEYLGSYLYGVLSPEQDQWFSSERAKELSKELYTTAASKLCEWNLIDESELLQLIDLLSIPFVPETRDEAKEKVREVLHTNGVDWLGDV